ncbi:MAG: chromosomal replication initiator protein DnaA [Robiginitomaculum sp.]|nr:chromosomal replication initiator protein DnaA [Robiginitomaculum sp.]
MANQTQTAIDHVDPAIDVGHVWSKVCREIESKISGRDFRSWISQLQVKLHDEGRLLLITPNAFSRDWINENLFDLVCDLWAACDPQKRLLLLRVASGEPVPTTIGERDNSSVDADPSMAQVDSAIFGNEKYRFDNFVVGPSNDVAWAVACQAARSTQSRFNPLFIHGGYGLGKTHLLRAIAHQARVHTPSRRILFLTAEEFVQKFISSLRGSQNAEFKKSVRSLDMLLIDDIHFLAGKVATQEEFVHTLSSLVENGAQVVLSADRSPGEIASLNDRLRSHLGGGVICRIAPAALELRRKILVHRCEDMSDEYENLSIPDDVLDFITVKISNSPRELLGALNMIVSGTMLVGRPVTLDAAKEILSDVVRVTRVKISIAQIQKGTVSWYGLGKDDLLSRRKTRNIVRPRQIAMYLAKELTSCSLPMIGQRFDGRDHTTVIHAVKTVQRLMSEDTTFADEVEGLRRSLTKLQS